LLTIGFKIVVIGKNLGVLFSLENYLFFLGKNKKNPESANNILESNSRAEIDW